MFYGCFCLLSLIVSAGNLSFSTWSKSYSIDGKSFEIYSETFLLAFCLLNTDSIGLNEGNLIIPYTLLESLEFFKDCGGELS